MALGRRTVAVNPYDPDYRARLAGLLAAAGQTAEADDEAGAALRLDPGNVTARQALISAALRAGDRERARREFDELLALRPPEPAGLRRWFAEQLRQR